METSVKKIWRSVGSIENGEDGAINYSITLFTHPLFYTLSIIILKKKYIKITDNIDMI